MAFTFSEGSLSGIPRINLYDCSHMARPAGLSTGSLCFRALGDSPPRPVHCVVLERPRQAANDTRSRATAGPEGIYGV